MSSIIEGYNYDIFVSYRQKDNKYDGWVTEFVDNLRKELEATFKEEINIYFDINPHDGLLETHDVDASLKDKLKCLVLIPIISRTYCDHKAFAWEHEFKAFIEQASNDQFGLKVKLPNGNVSSRVMPVQIHEITSDDKACIEKVLGGILRPVEFIYKEPGVNRSLRSNEDKPENNLNKTFYRNQINKVANAIDEILSSLKTSKIAAIGDSIYMTDILKEDNRETEINGKKKPVKPGKRKIVIGISILISVIFVAAFVFIIKTGSLKSFDKMTMPVTILNENGEKEVRRIYKDSYISRLAIFPFVNETGDSSVNWLQFGFPGAVYQDLSQFNYVILYMNTNVSHLQEKINESRANNCDYFLTGAFRVANGEYEITSRLYKTSNNARVTERTFKGNDFFSIIDSISLQARIDLDIPKNVINNSTDLPFMEQSTNNINAFRFFIRGIYIDSMITNLHRSIEFDSTFAIALYNSALHNHTYQQSYESAFRDIHQAMRHRQRLPEYNNFLILSLHYSIHGENNKAVALAEMQHELKPKDVILLSELLDTYEKNFIINNKYERVVQQLIELVPNDPYYLKIIANSFLLIGEFDKGLEVLNKVLKTNSEDVNALLQMGEIYLHKHDLEAAEKMYQKAILIQPENEKNWSKIFDYIAFSHNNPVSSEFLESFTGYYRFEDRELSIAFYEHNNHLVGQAKNQYPEFNYPVSNTKFTSVNGAASFTFVKNNQGRVIKTFLDQYGELLVAWKEDSLIFNAMELLDGKDKAKALDAFREAYIHNPDHYYLANFIQHLEFIESKGIENISQVLETYNGTYGNMTIFKKNNIYYYKNYKGYIFKLLPLSESQFMIPSFYNRIFRIVMKNNLINGLEVIYRDGRKEFFPRGNEKSSFNRGN